MTASEPDFDQMAHDICQRIWGNDILESTPAVTLMLADQLRQVWNARGAADIATVKAAYLTAPLDHVIGAIRSLDR